jgi:hypothetical protein
MKIYIAAPWKCREQARAAADFLKANGHVITSRWLIEHGDTSDPRALQTEALADMEDVRHCETLILLNLMPSRGKETELGLAYAWGKYLIGVGEKTSGGTSNVFYHIPSMHWVPQLEDVLELLQ